MIRKKKKTVSSDTQSLQKDARPSAASNPFALKEGHFAVVQTPKKTHLLQVTQSSADGYEGVVASSLDGEHFSFEAGDVLAVLPSDFAPGATAFGVALEAVRHVESGPLGPIAFYVDVTTEDRKAFVAAANDAVAWLKERRLLVDKEIALSFHAPKGKWAGSYKRNRKDAQPDALKVHSSLPTSQFEYVMGHEFGHSVWHHFVTPEDKGAWIGLYTKSISITHATAQDLALCFDALKAVDGDFKAAAVESGNKPLFAEILKTIKKTYRVRPITLAALAASGQWNRIEKLWPTDPIALGDPEELLSEYAKVAPEELFAEAFAEFYQGHQMPPKLEALMKRTLENAVSKAKPMAARKSKGTGEDAAPVKKKTFKKKVAA